MRSSSEAVVNDRVCETQLLIERDDFVVLTDAQVSAHDDSARLTLHSPAKVNWFLELLRKRDDGFHQLETVMSAVSLFDTLSFERRNDDRLNLEVRAFVADGVSKIPTGNNNLVMRAARLVRQHSSVSEGKLGANITLLKRTPTAAGLGGASSNAATTILGLNRIWNLKMPFGRMHQVASQLGSDVPFFLTGGTALCEGRGEKISRIRVPSGLWVVIGKPSTGLATQAVYSHVEIAKKQVKVSNFVTQLWSGRPWQIGVSLHNRLEAAAVKLNDEVKVVRNEFQVLEEQGQCCGHQLSGSGSSYFGLFPSQRMARRAASRLRTRLPGVSIYCCRTIGSCRLGKSDQGAVAA